jgi:hypothetical protein
MHNYKVKPCYVKCNSLRNSLTGELMYASVPIVGCLEVVRLAGHQVSMQLVSLG